MNLTIEKLEEIGENTSLKEHKDLISMLGSLNTNVNIVSKLTVVENICVLVPEDENDEDEINKEIR